MLDDIKKLLGSQTEVTEFATEIQKMTTQGNFDPFALFAGSSRLHSVFIGPFSPTLSEARTQFLADGTGSLANIVQNFQRDGVGPEQALESARAMFSAAQGMCVVVLVNDQGMDSIPQLFFGALDSAFADHVIKTCGEKFTHGEAVRSAIQDLGKRVQNNAAWWQLHGGAGDQGDATYWCSLAVELVMGMEAGVFGAAPERLRDLAWWIGRGACDSADAGEPIDADVLPAVLRCLALGGEPGAAFARLADRLGDMDEDDVVHALHQIAEVAIARGEGGEVVAWFNQHMAGLIATLGDAYDVHLVRFKAMTASAVPADVLVAAAGELIAADKKSARHELTREPLWRVTAAEYGEVVETAVAADLVGRSPTFIAKRLEQLTIPSVRIDEQIRLPKAALLAWKAVMDTYKLLD